MGRRMKNLNIFGTHGKIRVLGRGGQEKPVYRAWIVCRLTGG